MSDLLDLQTRFELTEEDANSIFDIVNWVTSKWLTLKFGYPKDSPFSFSLKKRLADEVFIQLLKKELEAHPLESQILEYLSKS